jgi:CHAT domain-containing protein
MARGLTAPAAASRLLAVQNPDRSLPFADWEAEEIAKLFPENSRRTLAGVKATRDAVVQSCSFGTETLFSCHAAFDTAAPEKSYLQLADGTLTLQDLLRADFRNASLIVMSACTSGVVDLQSLDVDEHFGLATACLVAGAQTVVASLWQVNDAATALLMHRFHRNLYTSGMDKARALQEAQIWLRDMQAEEAFAILEARQLDCEDEQGAADAAGALLELRDRGPKPFAHPYWWAAFQCIGSGWMPAAPKAEARPNSA